MLAVVRRVLGARHPEVDDVCQEAAVGLLSALPSFRGECSVMHFACRVALLAAFAARRRGARAVVEVTEDPDDVVDGSPSPAELLDSARRRRALRELLDALPLSQAEVLALHVVLGYTVEETGAMMGATVNTVRSRLRRGLAALREELGSSSRLREVIEGSHEQR
jgi:RNA polymerase sigma-70 factor (ECF subfamily)